MQEILKKRMKEWRRDIHKHPELGFNEKRTSEKIASILKEIGLDVFTGIGKTGVVAVLKNGELCEIASTENLFVKPAHSYTKELLKLMPKIESIYGLPK